jgi:hypothetical protein
MKKPLASARPDATKESIRAWNEAVQEAIEVAYQASLSVSSILIPDKKTAEGLLLKSTSVMGQRLLVALVSLLGLRANISELRVGR